MKLRSTLIWRFDFCQVLGWPNKLSPVCVIRLLPLLILRPKSEFGVYAQARYPNGDLERNSLADLMLADPIARNALICPNHRDCQTRFVAIPSNRPNCHAKRAITSKKMDIWRPFLSGTQIAVRRLPIMSGVFHVSCAQGQDSRSV
jgi:hypothetical protein